MKRITKVLVAAVFGLAAAGAHAQGVPATTTFQVQANVLAACTVSATNLVFTGYLASAASDNDSTSTITVTCSNGTTYAVGLGADPDKRTMNKTVGTGTLNYGMFSDAGYGTPFSLSGLAGTGAAIKHTVYGRVFKNQYSPAGDYADTVTVSVTY